MHQSFSNSIIQLKFVTQPNFAAASALTSRELRRFRSLYVSRTRVPFVSSSIDTPSSSLTFSFYGNAEAISPAQRRRFRETKTNTTNNNNNVKIQFAIFPTKRGTRLYSLTSLSFFNFLLRGTLICATVSIPSQLGSTETKPLINGFNIKKFQNEFSILDKFENSFSFQPSLITSKTVSNSSSSKDCGVLSRKYAKWKENQFSSNRNSAHMSSLDQIPALHLFPFDSLFLFSDIISFVTTDIILAVKASQELNSLFNGFKFLWPNSIIG